MQATESRGWLINRPSVLKLAKAIIREQRLATGDGLPARTHRIRAEIMKWHRYNLMRDENYLVSLCERCSLPAQDNYVDWLRNSAAYGTLMPFDNDLILNLRCPSCDVHA